MIHIDYSLFRPSKKWQDQSKKKLREILIEDTKADKTERNDLIENCQRHWTAIKPLIISITYNKCWYSEAPAETAVLQVDHFRPKKIVEPLPRKYRYREARTAADENCYCWLTLNHKNYRLCNGATNRSKDNYFPLLHNTPLATNYTSNLSLEIPILLDPTIKADTELLTFDMAGYAIPSAVLAINPYEYERARISIEVYGLNKSLILDARKRKLRDLNEQISKIDEYYGWLLADPTNIPMGRVILKECNLLLAMAQKDQPFSKMATYILKSIPYGWATSYVHPYL